MQVAWLGRRSLFGYSYTCFKSRRLHPKNAFIIAPDARGIPVHPALLCVGSVCIAVRNRFDYNPVLLDLESIRVVVAQTEVGILAAHSVVGVIPVAASNPDIIWIKASC